MNCKLIYYVINIKSSDNIMFYLVAILFTVAWIMLCIVRNYVETKSPIAHKYLNHGIIKVCQLKSVYVLIILAKKLYLSYFSHILNIYIVLMLLKRWVNKIKLSAPRQNFFNKILISERPQPHLPASFRGGREVYKAFFKSDIS